MAAAMYSARSTACSIRNPQEDEALARSLGPEAHALWTLVAFMANPTGHEATFAAVMSSPVVQELLDSFRNLAFVSAFQAWSEHAVSTLPRRSGVVLRSVMSFSSLMA